MEKYLVLFAVIFLLSGSAGAQDLELLLLEQADTGKLGFIKPLNWEVEESEIINLLDREPNFGVYHDNYFITGIPTHTGINKYSADAKFQVSVRQRLFKSLLPFNTVLFLTYTQKSFWNVYTKSSPFK